jgi:hypothetical protein
MNKMSILAAVSVALSASGAADAALTVYSSQPSFAAAISNPGVDSYNDLTSAATVATPLSRTAGAYSYTASVGPVSEFFPAGGLGDVWLAPDNRGDTIQFSGFAAPVRGVGGFFFGSDENGAFTATPSTITVMATDADGSAFQALVNPSTSTFLGFVSNRPISSISVWVGTQGVGTSGVWPTINNLTLGVSPVPEPQPFLLAIAGLALIRTVAARRKEAR